jgi:hypothetical protein
VSRDDLFSREQSRPSLNVGVPKQFLTESLNDKGLVGLQKQVVTAKDADLAELKGNVLGLKDVAITVRHDSDLHAPLLVRNLASSLEGGYELQCNAITNVVWLLEFSKKCQFWFSNISELENHQFQFLEETNQNQRTTWSSYVKNLKEPVVFMKELVKTSGFMASFFFPAFLKTVVIYQNWGL